MQDICKDKAYSTEILPLALNREKITLISVRMCAYSVYLFFQFVNLNIVEFFFSFFNLCSFTF